ncbi:hypothetical protein [Novipirellula rosea]|uniref:hypothetical protein n=1 Tax=Novipirellula rosea TaxID=1031540 RepID=UPI0031E4ECA0
MTAVEEEWQLNLNSPNASRSSPQLNCMISTIGVSESYYTILLINQNAFGGGGLELQLWNGLVMLDSSGLGTFASLATADEKIQWTTRMELDSNGLLKVQILNGTSTTWGKFGGKSNLLVSTQTTLANLNTYDPNITANSSGVEFGNQRVNKLILRKVRVYTNNKKSIEQAVDRVVFEN